MPYSVQLTPDQENGDDLDDLFAQTPAFQALIARSRASLQSEEAISVHDLLAEAQAELAHQQQLQSTTRH